MALIELPVGGLQSRQEDEQVPFSAALEAADCYLDRDSVRGRNGYRCAVGSSEVDTVYTKTWTFDSDAQNWTYAAGSLGWNNGDGSPAPGCLNSVGDGETGADLAGGAALSWDDWGIPHTDKVILVEFAAKWKTQNIVTGSNLLHFIGYVESFYQSYPVVVQDLTDAVVPSVWHSVDGTNDISGGGGGLSYSDMGGVLTPFMRCSQDSGGASNSLQTYFDTVTVTVTTKGTAVNACNQVGSGLPQHMGRHRPNASSARTIAVVGGTIYKVTDPSSETLTDGVATSLGLKFGTTANISGAELNREYYLATDEVGVAWQRVKSDFTLEGLNSLPQPTIASDSLGSLSWFKYRGGAISSAVSGCVLSTTVGGLLSSWYGVVGTTGDTSQPTSGATVVITLTNAVDITGVDWIAFGVSPPDANASGGTSKQVVIELSSDNSNFYPVGTITDVPPVGGSPNLIFCNILASSMPAASKAAWKYIRFTVNNVSDPGTNLRYALYGHLVIPNRRNPQPQQYFLSIKNTATGERSNLSAEFDVNQADVSLPTYTDEYIANDSFNNTANQLQPLASGNLRNWNQQAGSAEPNPIDIGVPVTLSGTAPTLVGAGPFQAELWTQTENGIRLVGVETVTSGGGWSIVDNGGIAVLQNELWVPTGTPPNVMCLTAMAGRLVGGFENRLWISNFIAPVDLVNAAPFPSFPAVPVQDSDGWAFDIAPSNDEQILVVHGITGDSLYICTNEWCKMMRDLRPGSVPFNVLDRGAMGRQSWCFGDNTFFWASWDGIYAVQNQANWSEVSQDIRRIYTDWFQPDSTVVMGYKDRKLYAFRGRLGLRLDMVTNRWTRMTVADTFALSVGFKDPGAKIQQLWFMTSDRHIGRWQDIATSDMMVGASAGTAIPDWVYSTGFMVRDVKVRNKFAYLDITGSVSAGLAKTVGSAEVTKTFSAAGEHELSLGPTEGYKWRLNMTGANAIAVKRMMLEQEATMGKGG